jgi:ABC transporter with metal-binding/Fe-S-binding domain ATP-binding protein
MKVACFYSGGKDSNFALFWALFQGFEPVLITVKGEEYSMMFHHPNIDKTKLQAKSLGVKQHFLKTNDKNWFKDMKALLKKLKVQGIVAGAIASEYQRRKIDKLGEELGIPTYAPLWHKQDELMQELVQYFETYIIAVSAEGLDEKWLGKQFKELAKAKIPNIHPFLEGGEGETYVANAPFFKKRIKIKGWKKKWDGVRGEAEIIL